MPLLRGISAEPARPQRVIKPPEKIIDDQLDKRFKEWQKKAGRCESARSTFEHYLSTTGEGQKNQAENCMN